MERGKKGAIEKQTKGGSQQRFGSREGGGKGETMEREQINERAHRFHIFHMPSYYDRAGSCGY